MKKLLVKLIIENMEHLSGGANILLDKSKIDEGEFNLCRPGLDSKKIKK